MYLNFLTFLVTGLLLNAPLVAKDKPVKIQIWEEERPEIQEALDRAIKEFQKTHPAVTVKRTHYKTEDLRTHFQIAAIAGGGPDLILAPNDFAGVLSVSGTIQPATAFLVTTRFAPEVLEAIRDKSGKIWGVPINRGNHLILFTNRRLLPESPTSVEKLVVAGKKVTDKSKRRYGLAYNAREPFWFVPFLGAFGDLPLVDRQPNLSSPAMVNALTLVKDLQSKHQITPEDCDYGCADTLFLEGRAAMTINGDWTIQRYHEAFGKDLIISPLPLLEQTEKHMRPMVSGKYLMFNRKLKGDSLKQSRAFVDFLVSDKLQESLTRETKRLPALESAAMQTVIKDDPLLAASLAAMTHSQPMPFDVEMRAVWDAIRPELQEVLAGRARPSEASRNMQVAATKRIKEMRQ